mmetsp:Transcript_24663/g.60576  ORF Transcript_24663/g.60576 Transcript_24663/m.60576 type:complete len:670 (-) Transcript_24663:3120-5129(-)
MKFRNLLKLRMKPPPRDDDEGNTNHNNHNNIEGDEGSAQVISQDDDDEDEVFVYKGKSRRRHHHKNIIPTTITHATVHPSVRQIHDFLFQDFTHLVSMDIPKTVKHIHQFAFKGCTALRTLELHPGLITIERGAFEGCRSLVGSIMLEDDDNNKNGTFAVAKLQIPNTVESIGWYAFSGCTSVTHVQFPQQKGSSRLKTLERGAFLSCESLIQVDLPIGSSSLKTIGVEAFCWCESLTTVSIPLTVELIGGEAFAGCKSLVNVHLENGLKTIGERAFGWCSSLVNIDLPQTVETIDFFAFGYCSSLANVQLPQGLKSIGQCAFTNCTALFAIALPLSLEEICLKAFSDCTSLRTVEFPKDTTRLIIGKNCFHGCKSLVNVSLSPSDSGSPLIVFAGCDLLLQGDNALRLHKRFDSLPVHEVCCHSSTTTIPSVVRALGSSSSSILEQQNNVQDAFGMTPFHILAAGFHPSVQVLQSLLKRYKVDTLELKDRFEKTMMDYLLLNTSSSKAVVPLIQTVLERAIVDRICSRGGCTGDDSNNINNKWRSELTRCLGALEHHAGSVESRRNHVHECFFGTVGYCVRLEMTSMMELALWKMRMTRENIIINNNNPNEEEAEEADDDDDDDNDNDRSVREDCRYQCGSEVVIEKVVGYLWHGESRSDTALSTFPI